jgi:hypothetical protein
MRKRMFFLAVLLAFAGRVAAQDDAPSKPAAPEPLSREELRDRQLDIAYEARDVERILTKLKRASELSKTMIGEVAETAEAVSSALDQGDSAAAKSDARTAAEKFREIAKLLEALLAEETPPKIAAARDLANRLARLEREFARQLERQTNPESNNGSGPNENPDPEPRDNSQGAPPSEEKPDDRNEGSGGEQRDREPRSPTAGSGRDDPEKKTETAPAGPRQEELVAHAEKLARDGRILEDILKALADSSDPGDQEKAEQVSRLLEATRLLDAVDALQRAADEVRDQKFPEARLAALDTADRMELTARRLDALYRAVVAPQIEELRQLEQGLADLREKLDHLETEGQIGAWHREAMALLDQGETLDISDALLAEWLEQLNAYRMGAFQWDAAEKRFLPAQNYGDRLARVQQEVQEQIQSLLLNDFASRADEKTPPKYQELVERYYRVLAGEKPNASSAGRPEPTSK